MSQIREALNFKPYISREVSMRGLSMFFLAVLLAGAVVSAQDTTDGLVVYYPFDNMSLNSSVSTIVDSTNYSNNSVVFGNAPVGIVQMKFPLFYNSTIYDETHMLDFTKNHTNVQSYVLSSTNGIKGFTANCNFRVSLWYCSVVPCNPSETLLKMSNSSNLNSIHIYVDTLIRAKQRFSVAFSVNSGISATSFYLYDTIPKTFNTFHRVVISRQLNTLMLAVDSTVHTTVVNNLSMSLDQFSLGGCEDDGSQEYFTGYIDNVKIYNLSVTTYTKIPTVLKSQTFSQKSMEMSNRVDPLGRKTLKASEDYITCVKNKIIFNRR
jgi:hypothetical protein